MSTKQYPIIAREGWARLILILFVGMVLHFGLGAMASLPVWVFFCVTVYQFRDPSRSPPSLPLAVVSPIHGIVSVAKHTPDPWLKRPALMIEVRGGLFDIKSIYSPTEGKIMNQWRTGHEVDDAHANAIAYWLQTDEGDDVVLELKQLTWRGPMSFRYNPGERVGQGRRVGFVNNGCIARVYVADNSLLAVGQNESVKAAESVLANFVHLTQMAAESDQRLN